MISEALFFHLKRFLYIIEFTDTSLHYQLFYPGLPIAPPKTWKAAFTLLTNEIIKLSKTKKVVVFLDELPRIASPKSAFLQNLDYFWNSRWNKLSNFKLIVCGSAASWILNNLINAKGGLHNRITRTILLQPFNLFETQEFLQSKKIKLPEKQIVDLYMTLGGVPYYLEQLDPSESLDQNINRLCFTKEGLLFSEFPRLFKSLFNASELHMLIVKEMAKKHYGISFKELVLNVHKKAGGRFKTRLEELEACGFNETTIIKSSMSTLYFT